MRTSDLLLISALSAAAACSSEKAPDPVAVAPEADRIECALAGAAQFGRDCSVERNGTEIVLHHRDGGFRRLLVGEDGSLTAADGAQQPTTAALAGDLVEIGLGGDRYRLPKAIGDETLPGR